MTTLVKERRPKKKQEGGILMKGHHGKGKDKGLVTDRIDVDVTPVDQCAEMVICELDPSPGGAGGSYVTDGVLFLVDNKSYEIKFHLKNGYSWDDDPFWARRAKCPDRTGMPGQFTSCTANNGTLTVEARGIPGKSAVHFRLNMLDPDGNPVFCDPIIINN